MLLAHLIIALYPTLYSQGLKMSTIVTDKKYTKRPLRRGAFLLNFWFFRQDQFSSKQ